MGCTESSEEEAPTAPDAGAARGPPKPPQPKAAPKEAPPPSPPKKAQGDKLLDTYKLGKAIGQGAFGIVYSCKLKTSGDQFAVKMIDLVETPLEEITREVEMLRLLAHPCVVAMRDVFYEKVFVCLVMEIYKGGDMIEGQQLHWKSKGNISIRVVQNVSKMMFQALEWLHQNSIVHRDLKGDNFLQSVKAIEDRNCRVYMSDFGTVVALSPGERLGQKCGTKTYWAPEFYRMDYGFSVDVWAIGVVMFGLVSKRFPFNGEADVKGKDPKIPSRATADGQAFIAACLKKKDAERLSAAGAIQHKFLASIKSTAEIAAEVGQEEKDENAEGGEIREQGANAGVKQRRRDLVNRLEQAEIRSNTTEKVKVRWNQNFEVEDRHAEKTTRFEWWRPEKLEKAGFLQHEGSQAQERADAFAEEQIKQKLEEHHISTARFGTGEAKSCHEFLTEVLSGESRLMLDATKHKNMVRVIDVVLLRIVWGSGVDKRYLIQYSETFPDGRVRDKLNNLPGTKKRPHENGRQVVERMIEERMRMTSANVKCDFDSMEYMEDDEESPSYPGVRTVYRKEIYEGEVQTKDPVVLKQFGLSGDGVGTGSFTAEGMGGYSRLFCWASEGACVAKGIKLRAPKEGFEVSPLVPTPVGYDEEELQTFMAENNVDVSAFAQQGPGSLLALAEELQIGDATLTRQSDGRIMRVVEVIVLTIVKKNGDMLVQASQTIGGGAGKKERLPGVKRRQDENMFWAAHRLINESLKINENRVKMDASDVRLIEEVKPSEVYTNLPTIYRRRIVKATLVED